MLDVRFTGQFKKDLAKVEKQNKQIYNNYEGKDIGYKYNGIELTPAIFSELKNLPA